MTDLPSDAHRKRPLDKRTALAVLDYVRLLLQAESIRHLLLDKELLADGFGDASILVRELRDQVALGTVSQDYLPPAMLALSVERCGKRVAAGSVQRCRRELSHEGDCEP